MRRIAVIAVVAVVAVVAATTSFTTSFTARTTADIEKWSVGRIKNRGETIAAGSSIDVTPARRGEDGVERLQGCSGWGVLLVQQFLELAVVNVEGNPFFDGIVVKFRFESYHIYNLFYGTGSLYLRNIGRIYVDVG